MPKQSIDSDAAITAISQLLSITVQQALNDFPALDRLISEGMSWSIAAVQLNIPRDKLYHWYRDTYRRRNLSQVTAADRNSIDLAVLEKLMTGVLTSNSKKELHAIFPQYEWTVFSVAYNNARAKAKSNPNILNLIQYIFYKK
ncbi:hypothetical protein SS50377_21811 [Spironucleus salmonicida]|uniref:Uncharacterized protein n=1 Tax=Spironucleus salmonicida TaxID=348837 RepID=V6LM68_9EUKA|nr:hypothetical protein SS50377_21811 [Spironucleus salmonicida]|eukprot:EST44801.1 hypothetical protein SS50377_15310 [Spironucleus salmonicida]